LIENKNVYLGQKNKKDASRVLFNLYIIWLIMAFILGRVGGYLDTGKTSDLLALIAEIVFFLILFFVWRYQEFINNSLNYLKLQGKLRFILVGLVIAYIGEIYYYFISQSSLNIAVFLMRTLAWYIAWYLSWWWLINKYHYSAKEVFLWAGLNGYIVEGIFLHQLPVLSFIGLFLYPLVAAAYGIMIIVPYMLTKNDVNMAKQNLSVSMVKKYSSTLLPLITFIIPGQIWFYLVEIVFKR
jgi:hypothetical protein